MPAALQEQGVKVEAERSRRRVFVRYLAALFGAMPAGVGLLLAIGGSHWYVANGSNPGVRLIGYSQWMRPRNCAVVLYGDSSALTALDPAVIQARTGLTACNVAEGTNIHKVAGSDLPLQAYLRRNAAPRYIVGMWTPSIYLPDQPAFSQYSPEGMTYVLNFMKRRALFEGLTRNPSWILQFCSDLTDDLEKVAYRWLHGPKPRDVRQERIERGGQWMFPLLPETECAHAKMHYDPDTFPWLPSGARLFRQKYATAQTRVFVDVSPVPDCETLYDLYARRLAGWHDNAFERLPIRFFSDSDAHFSPEGSRYVSEKVAEQILEAERAATL